MIKPGIRVEWLLENESPIDSKDDKIFIKPTIEYINKHTQMLEELNKKYPPLDKTTRFNF